MTVEEILAALQAIIDEAEGRDLTDEEVERYEELEAKLKAAQRSEEIRRRQAAYMTPSQGLQVAVKDKGDEDTLERAFEAYLRTGQENQDIAELRAQSTNGSGGAAGGYTVPEGFRQKLVERMKAFGGLAGEAEEVVTSTGAPLEWPTLDDTSNSAEVVAELATPASAGADLTFGTLTLGAFKYVSSGTSNQPLKVSWELLQDSSFDIAGLVARKLGERLARKFSRDIVQGAGTTEPVGLINGPTPIEMFTNLATPTGDEYGELIDFIHNLDPAYRGSAKWLMNDTTLAFFRKMVDGNGRPLWLPAAESGMTNLPGGTLLGYPVVIDQAMPSMGDDATAVAFGDFRQGYVVRRVRDITVVALNESYATEGAVGYIAWMRADGAPQDENAYILGEGEIDPS